MILALLALLLADAPAPPAPTPECGSDWTVVADGCSYTVATAPGSTHGDTSVGPLRVVAKAKCGETVEICGKKRTCVCSPVPPKRKSP